MVPYSRVYMMYCQICQTFRAIKRFSAAIRVDPTYLRGYVCRAEAYDKVGHVSILYESKCGLRGVYLTSTSRITCCIKVRGIFPQLKEAIDDFTRVIHLRPDVADYRMSRVSLAVQYE